MRFLKQSLCEFGEASKQKGKTNPFHCRARLVRLTRQNAVLRH